MFRPALFFYIKLKSNPNLVVDVKGDDKNAGAKVILYESKGNMADNQLWYEDKQGFLRSKINEFTMDLTGLIVNIIYHRLNSLIDLHLRIHLLDWNVVKFSSCSVFMNADNILSINISREQFKKLI